MTKAELVKELMELAENEDYDQEVDHRHADNLLLEYIDDKKVYDAYDAIRKWYA